MTGEVYAGRKREVVLQHGPNVAAFVIRGRRRTSTFSGTFMLWVKPRAGFRGQLNVADWFFFPMK